MPEKVLCEEGEVRVTTVRVVVGATSYFVASMVSSQCVRLPPNRRGPLLLGVVGIFLLLIPTAAAVVWWLCQRPRHGVLVSWSDRTEVICIFPQPEPAERIALAIQGILPPPPAGMDQSPGPSSMRAPTTQARRSVATASVFAAGLLVVDALLIGQGFLSVFVILFATPILVIRALLAWRNRHELRCRMAVAGVLLFAALAGLWIIGADQEGARRRAESIIAACEAYKGIHDTYPERLSLLIPQHLAEIPPARRRGLSRGEFDYILAPAGTLFQTTNETHVLLYISTPPFGRTYYVLEERRWGFYD
jgi:hypothetical protein